MPLEAWLLYRRGLEAIQNGQLQEAEESLALLTQRGDRRASKLRERLVSAYLQSAEKHHYHDDDEGAWADLLKAEAHAPHGVEVLQMRDRLVNLGLAQLRALLEHALPGQACEVLSQLQARSVRHPDLPVLHEIARDWLLAQDMAERGDFALAIQTLKGVHARLNGQACNPTGLQDALTRLTATHLNYEEVRARVQDAVAQRDWRQVMHQAEAGIVLAPRNPEFHQLRGRAWEAMAYPGQQTITHAPSLSMVPPASVNGSVTESGVRRFLLWVDGVGGFLVCLAPRISLGQAGLERSVDVPIYADLSRFHACLIRDPEGYLLEGPRHILVNGMPVEGRQWLSVQDRITLGRSCQFIFQCPVPISTTALLQLVSGHRMPLGVDGVLLMAENVILGPGQGSHVAIPSLSQPIILTRAASDQLRVSFPGRYCMDGQTVEGQQPLSLGTNVWDDHFSFAVEPIDERLGAI